MSNKRGPGPIPNRWLYCPRKSETRVDERFIAFKTPLSLAFKDQMPLECIFTPEMIFDWCKTLKLKLGLWIDLTNTKRFYDRSVVEGRDAQYVKLQCRGHGETPSIEQTRSFIEIVDAFINERPFDLIGVHCTHGFNRTGFLIVSYMVERLDCSLEAALSVFAQARPPGIYKQDYINELYRRYENDEEEIMQAPEMPAWCFDYDDSDKSTSRKRTYSEAHGSQQNQGHSQQAVMNGGDNRFNGDDEDAAVNDDSEQVEDDDDNAGNGNSNKNSARKKRRREMIVKNASFMEGVGGVQLVTDQPRLGDVQRKVQDMCNWNKSGFPGAQPVSMDQQNLQLLHEIPYRVSWKADGMRYMMLIQKRGEIFFIDRNNSVFEVENLTFLTAGKLGEHLEDTLLDGEMVLDKFEGVVTPRYLIYDVVKISNRDIGNKPFFPDRLICIKKEIIEPRHEAIGKQIINRNAEPFSVRMKDFWELKYAERLLSEKFAKSLLHEPDGLIFQPSQLPYSAGVCSNILKWKPSELNSVDFRLKIIVESGMGIVPKKIGLLFVGGHETYYAKIAYKSVLKELDNKIVECTVNNKGEWEFLRERTDKTMPNSFNTANAVVQSIRHPVTKHLLLDFIACHGFRDDHDMMPPPSKMPHTQRMSQQQQQHYNRHQQQQQQLHHHHQQQQQQHRQPSPQQQQQRQY